MKLERLDKAACDWAAMDAFADREVFQSRAWLDFIVATHGGEVVVAAVKEDDGRTVGYFSGVLIRRLGVKILGSPLPGWATPYLGFNLEEGVSRRSAWAALPDFAFGTLGCVHLEVRDRLSTPETFAGLGFDDHRPLRVFEIDLRRTEDELLAAMSGGRRRGIRQGERRGIVVEEADDPGFADEYYAQLKDVFAKQSLVPNYGVERVRELIRLMHPTGNLLLLRARDSSGACVATGIFPALNHTMHFWGGASWREAQGLHPNEPLMWHAMRYWKARGIATFDMGGAGDYKRKYGPTESFVPTVSRSRFRAMLHARTAIKAAVDQRQRLLGRLRQGVRTDAATPDSAGDSEGSPLP
jgi:CelD/BcsL family acetyltransferase involved in cellulose biosynthesis